MAAPREASRGRRFDEVSNEAVIERLAGTHTLAGMRQHSTQTRDAGLRRLARANRWLIAGSVALTGVLTEVAAQAFPGKTLHASSASGKTSSQAQSKSSTGTSSNS